MDVLKKLVHVDQDRAALLRRLGRRGHLLGLQLDRLIDHGQLELVADVRRDGWQKSGEDKAGEDETPLLGESADGTDDGRGRRRHLLAKRVRKRNRNRNRRGGLGNGRLQPHLLLVHHRLARRLIIALRLKVAATQQALGLSAEGTSAALEGNSGTGRGRIITRAPRVAQAARPGDVGDIKNRLGGAVEGAMVQRLATAVAVVDRMGSIVKPSPKRTERVADRHGRILLLKGGVRQVPGSQDVIGGKAAVGKRW